MAPGEGFEPPWGDPSGFRDHRPTGLGDPGAQAPAKADDKRKAGATMAAHEAARDRQW